MENIPLSSTIKNKASEVQIALSNVILASFGGSDYLGFTNNKNGIHMIFPKKTIGTKDSLSYLYWYTSVDIASYLASTNDLYGKLSFCSGGSENGIVENWFEMIDRWYDDNTKGTSQGLKGYNGYNY